MGTDIQLLVKARQMVYPRDVTYPLPIREAGALVVLDHDALKRQVEWFACKRKLNWEEWQDVRAGWCAWYRAQLVTCVKGDSYASDVVTRAASQGIRAGNQYLLLEYV